MWQPRFSVGHPELDSQHQQLLSLCRQAFECLDDSSIEGTAQFHLILNELLAYTDKHFRAEEQILKNCNFPESEAHRSEHVDYQLGLSEFLIEATCGTVDKERLAHYLNKWWCHHILESDMQYRPYVSETA